MKWYHDFAMFLFNLLLLTVLLHFAGIAAVIVFGFAKILTEQWKAEISDGK